MLYAKIHTYNGNQTTVATRQDQPDVSWVGYNVASADWLYISAGAIAVHTQAEMDAIAAAAIPMNKKSFITAMNTALGGILASNTYAVQYPLFAPSFDADDWTNASALITDALAKGVISTVQYTAIKTAATTYKVPLTLP